jgi:hypothetical protein
MILKCNYKAKVFFIIILFILLLIVVNIFNIHVLEIKNINKNEILFQEKIFPGYIFATKIKHSVQLTPVLEFFEIDENYHMLLTKTIVKDLGWGMPSNPEGDFSYQNGEMVIENINKKVTSFIFRVSYISKPELILRGRTYDLRFLVDDSDALEIGNKRISIINRICFLLSKKS